jgi:hypothetical protein
MPKPSQLNVDDTNTVTSATDQQNHFSHSEPESKSHPMLEKLRAFRHKLPLIVRLPLALLFLVVGILGGFIPILQGWLFILIACWLLFPDHSERLFQKIKDKLMQNKKNETIP